MSSCSLFSAAGGSIAVAAPKCPAQIVERLSALPQLATVTSASQLNVRPAPEMVSSGIRAIDALTGGLPRGCLTEVCGTASSGRTSVLLATLTAATERQETCALVDVSDAFDPASAANAGVNFERLLWVRCGIHDQDRKKQEGHDFSRANQAFLRTRALAPESKKRNSAETPVEQALRVTDLLLQSGGFGLVAIDLGDVPWKMARRIPLTSWFRFQRAVEHTPAVLFVITQAPCTQSCASLLLQVRASGKKLSAVSSQLSAMMPAHAQLLDGLHVEGELLRARLQRKPVQSVTAAFVTRAIRAG